MFDAVYKDRRVLITGHTGFKGSWLSAWLLSLGATVAGYSISVPTTPSNFEILNLKSKITHFQGDVCNLQELKAAIQSFQPEIIFHLAAQALVRRSYLNPVETIQTNAIGTLNIVEAVRSVPCIKALVCITSDKCYRNDEWVWGYKETDHLGGFDPYSASKGCAEIIAHSYFNSFFQIGPKAATVRAGNVIGGGDWAEDRIVPDCVKAWIKGEKVLIRSPWATRPWQHVLEPLSGYLWLAARLFTDKELAEGLSLDKQAFNFGPLGDVNNTVAEVVENLTGYWQGFQAELNKEAVLSKKECTLLKLNCDKALAYLNWKATLDFSETIAFTAEWYKAYAGNKKSMFDFTMKQLADYVVKAKVLGLRWAS